MKVIDAWFQTEKVSYQSSSQPSYHERLLFLTAWIAILKIPLVIKHRVTGHTICIFAWLMSGFTLIKLTKLFPNDPEVTLYTGHQMSLNKSWWVTQISLIFTVFAL